ncbi:MAG: RBBP9/YdeN family alpha/beta hydrolase [Candidatus Paceibacteria bacterium]
MNTKVFLIHGFEGVPNGGWRSYLMGELSKLDIYACSLSMPTPEAPVLSEWLEEVRRVVERNPNDDIYLVGHSLGGTTILRFAEMFDYPNLKGLISVSAPCSVNKNEKIRSFLDKDFDFGKIKNTVPHIAVIHGDDDPLVPLSDAEKIARETGGELVVIPGGKHLNGSAGFTALPECLALLKNFLNIHENK